MEHLQQNSFFFVLVNMQDGIGLTIESFSHLAKDSPFGRFLNFEGQSKAEKLLGSGIGWDLVLLCTSKIGLCGDTGRTLYSCRFMSLPA